MSIAELIALLLCVGISFCFSGVETGLLLLNKIRLRHHARRRDQRRDRHPTGPGWLKPQSIGAVGGPG